MEDRWGTEKSGGQALREENPRRYLVGRRCVRRITGGIDNTSTRRSYNRDDHTVTRVYTITWAFQVWGNRVGRGEWVSSQTDHRVKYSQRMGQRIVG